MIDTEVSKQLLALLDSAPNGVETADLCAQIGKTPQQLGVCFESLKHEKRAFGFAGIWVSCANFEKLTLQVEEAMRVLHESQKRRVGFSQGEISSEGRLGWSDKPFDRLVTQLANDGRLVLIGQEYKLPEAKPSLTEKQHAHLDRVREAMERYGAVAPPPYKIAQELGVPEQAVGEYQRMGVATGELVKIEEELLFSKETVEQFRSVINGLRQPFTVAEFRDAAQSSRRIALAVLNFFDRELFTVREGDTRTLAKSQQSE